MPPGRFFSPGTAFDWSRISDVTFNVDAGAAGEESDGDVRELMQAVSEPCFFPVFPPCCCSALQSTGHLQTKFFVFYVPCSSMFDVFTASRSSQFMEEWGYGLGLQEMDFQYRLQIFRCRYGLQHDADHGKDVAHLKALLDARSAATQTERLETYTILMGHTCALC